MTQLEKKNSPDGLYGVCRVWDIGHQSVTGGKGDRRRGGCAGH